MKTTDAISTIIQKPIRDILVCGLVASERVRVFYPIYERVYFLFSDEKIEMHVGVDGKTSFRSVGNIELWFDLDEDTEFATMSIYNQVFGTEPSAEPCVKVVSAACDDASLLSEFRIEYLSGDLRSSAVFSPKNFFGFSFRRG